MADLRYFERYRPLVDDWPAFAAALVRPLPTCIWTNTLRTTPGRLQEVLAASGVHAEPLPWQPGAFRWRAEASPGRHVAFRAGLFHVQEEVSMLPVPLLDPQPGERVLDLCAAPGNKTAQMAVAMRDRGTVVANDWNHTRSRAISGILDRLGITCACTTTCDAGNLPPESGLFDRVLADVPCTAEGTVRKHPALLAPGGHPPPRRLTGVQEAILRKAVQRCRPGGRIVYATCTFAPEENEGVVDAVLRAYGDRLRLLPARIPGFHTSPGLTAWNGTSYDPAMTQTLRAWPHHNDSGGFFVAVLEKRRDVVETEHGLAALPVDPDGPGWMERVCAHFGFPQDLFAGYDLIRTSSKYLSIVARAHQPPARPEPDSIGLSFVRTRLRPPKLTTAAALAFGHAATRNVISVSGAQAEMFFARTAITVTPDQAAACTGAGYVLLRHDGTTLGVGLYTPSPEGGRVESLFPKAWAVDEIGG